MSRQVAPLAVELMAGRLLDDGFRLACLLLIGVIVLLSSAYSHHRHHG